MSYITQHHAEIEPSTPPRSSPPYRPFTNLTPTDQQLQGSRSVHPHFHRPFNEHSRYLAVASGVDRSAYRYLPRYPPPLWDGSTAEEDERQEHHRTDPSSRRRPASAPPDDRTGSRISVQEQRAASPTLRLDLRNISLTDNMVTATGRPCYTVSAFVEADLNSGTPVADLPPGMERKGRVAVVQTYPVPPSIVGYGVGGARPFHQDYRHYKYFGFAGKGATTSWAQNPKYSKLYADFSTSGGSNAAQAAHDVPVAPPLQEVVGGPRRSLTATEKKLVQEFKWHNYDAEGIPSDPIVARLLAQVSAGVCPSPRTLRHLKLPPQQEPLQERPQRLKQRGPGASRPSPSTHPLISRLEAEILDPYTAKVDLERRQTLPSGTRTRTRDGSGAARVTTYRQMASPYAAEFNRSPNHGSQSPWHQRYSHYKHSGFAGRGATSSWARNPKYAYLYD